MRMFLFEEQTYSPQYGMLTFLLHFMTNTFFSRRSGRHEVTIGKLQYIKELQHLEHVKDESCKEKDVTVKKRGKTKTYIVAQRKI